MNKAVKISFDIIKYLQEHGSPSYLIGGSSRDYLLGYDFTDIDIASSKPPIINQKILSEYEVVDLKGKPYGTLKYCIDDYNVEVTSFRKESAYVKYRRPKSVEFVDSMEIDSLRRDFTINAIYIDKDQKVFDFHGGLNDLKLKKIAIIGNLEQKMKEDALRILRAIRLAAKLDFTIEAKLKEFIMQNHQILNNLSASMIEKEFIKMKKECDLEKIRSMLIELKMDEYIPKLDN